MNKREALDILIDDKLVKIINKQFDYETFVNLISQHSYNLRELGKHPTVVSKFLKELVPGKPNNTKVCSWLFRLNNHKYCPKCEKVKHVEDFHTNSGTRDGLGSECITCHYSDLVIRQPNATAKRKAAKLQRTPSWANLNKIKEIYDNCPDGYHVDHIIPLQGDTVSGLHIESNLQYLTARDNIIKSNKYMLERRKR